MSLACSRCGAALPVDTPEQLCPRCLLHAALENGNATPARPDAPATAAYSSGFPAPAPEDLQKHFPAFEILELLGKGGMGAVYKARQITLDRLVAIKILPPHIGHDGSFAERFAREARSLAKLNHPNIVGVYDFGQAGGFFYFVMEYVDGVNVRQAMRAGALAPPEALKIVPQVCDALQFAHDEGIVHRDIKPENILLDKKGRVKIADFGLAKILTGGERGAPDVPVLTGTQQVMGTLHYMAPEQVEGTKNVDHRADIYSLGVTFYEMLTGELPLGRFAPPSQKVQIDVRLDEVVLRTLEKEPDKRYQHVSQVKTEVETIGGLPAAAVVVVRQHSALARYMRWAGWPTLACWAAALLPRLLLPLLARRDLNDVDDFMTMKWAFLVLGLAIPLYCHYLWLVFGQGVPVNASARARHAGHWLFGMGIAYLALAALDLVVGTTYDTTSRGEPNASFVIAFAVGVFLLAAVQGTLFIRGGRKLARLEDSLETRVAAVFAMLPLAYLWPFALPLGALVLHVLGRDDVRAILRKNDASPGIAGSPPR